MKSRTVCNRMLVMLLFWNGVRMMTTSMFCASAFSSHPSILHQTTRSRPRRNSIRILRRDHRHLLQLNVVNDKKGSEDDEGVSSAPPPSFFPTPKEEPKSPRIQSSSQTSSSSPSRFLDTDSIYVVVASAAIGILSGLFICLFKLSIEWVRTASFGELADVLPIFLIPVVGGMVVALVSSTGPLAPGLRGTVNEVDQYSMTTSNDAANGTVMSRFLNQPGRFIRKPLAAIATLGTGNSLGPEGPSVEIGMSVSRLLLATTTTTDNDTDSSTSSTGKSRINHFDALRRNRLLLESGAAAGVAAGFNAPLAGVFFALEVVQKTPLALEKDKNNNDDDNDISQEEYLIAASGESENIAAILLASVLSALVSQAFLSESLALSVPSFVMDEPLVELPFYLALGVVSGIVAGVFTGVAQFSKGVFDGEAGPSSVRSIMTSTPTWCKPILGALICGLIGLVYPQILFFGYETLNTLLAKDSMPTDLVLTLLVVKSCTTAIAAGSGLVGGTFAPSLFLGGMLGASFHNILAQVLDSMGYVALELADVQAYAIVGAAGVLAALFRAPLTGSLLLFELTRDYDVLLPVLASAGVGSLVGDIVEKILEEKRRDRDSVTWGDLADEEENATPSSLPSSKQQQQPNSTS